MIFFLTTIHPSSNILTALRKYRERLFRETGLAPHPLMPIPVRLSLSPPVRQSRKSIASEYPEILQPGRPFLEKHDLLIPLSPSISCRFDSQLESTDPIYPGNIHIGRFISETGPGIDFPTEEFPSFKNYSLITYRIETTVTSFWWRNFHWEKILEIRKGK